MREHHLPLGGWHLRELQARECPGSLPEMATTILWSHRGPYGEVSRYHNVAMYPDLMLSCLYLLMRAVLNNSRELAKELQAHPSETEGSPHRV